MEPFPSFRAYPVTPLIDPAILTPAEELVKAGWNGINQECFAPVPGNDKVWKGYQVVFQRKDFSEIQKVVQEILSNQRAACSPRGEVVGSGSSSINSFSECAYTNSQQVPPLIPPGASAPPSAQKQQRTVPRIRLVFKVDDLIQRKLDTPSTRLNAEESIALLMGCIHRGEVEAEKAINQELVVFIGNTGAGKSTFVNYLYGCKMVRKNPSDLGIRGPDRIVVVKPESPVKEIMPIGHSLRSMTFMPQIETDVAQNLTYCDCPGFLDNRGYEINIANAVNITNALIKSRSVKVIILINYHTLKADRGRGLSDMIKVCCGLFGSKENFIKFTSSILWGITQIPLVQVSDEEEENNILTVDDLKKWISDTPWEDPFEMRILQTLVQRLFIYDPLDNPKLQYSGAWKKQEIISKIANLSPIENPENIFKTVLTPEDEKGLITICEEIKRNIERRFQERNLLAEDFEIIAGHLENLKKLEIIDHIQVKKLGAEVRYVIICQFLKIVHAFDIHCADSNSILDDDSQKTLTDLVEGVRHFDEEVQKEINMQEVEKRYKKYVAKHDARMVVKQASDLERKFYHYCLINDFMKAEETIKELSEIENLFKQTYIQTGEILPVKVEDLEKTYVFSKSKHELIYEKDKAQECKIKKLEAEQEKLKQVLKSNQGGKKPNADL